MDAMQMAFNWIDTNHNGHIDADEFATFYANANIPGLSYTKAQWLSMFRQAVPVVDNNSNGQLEIDGLFFFFSYFLNA